jgi:FkbM family methyltransferase
MKKINDIRLAYQQEKIDKPSFIQEMYDQIHGVLFDYAQYLANTNIRKIEVEDGRVVITTRNRGIRLDCPQGDHRSAPIEVLNFLDYEKDELAMMERLIEADHNFFDIGANIGWYSINIGASRQAGGGHVFCFEPIPKTFLQLQTNIQINSLQNITVCNFGFSNKCGDFTFYYYPEGSGNASSANVTGREDIEEVQCTVRTLDDYTAETGAHVDFIKCDVEGAELLVFQGGIETIKRDLPIVFSEILRKWSGKFGYNPNEIFNLFSSQGYKAFTVDGTRLREFGVMDEKTIETNFFFLHSVKHAQQIHSYCCQL